LLTGSVGCVLLLLLLKAKGLLSARLSPFGKSCLLPAGISSREQPMLELGLLLLLLLGRRVRQEWGWAGGLLLFVTASDPKRVISPTPHDPAGSK
jgi:hypothetical protein